MSLKAFHIVFIVVCAMLCIALGVWSFDQFRQTRSNEFIWGVVCSFAGLVCLLIYGKWFLHKLRGVSYL
jgi:hypothetical protein